ncbi:MAG: hypothetical protein M1834_007911 [Cirrosporium novae-zelandiae]|nr:MAG: hypothetical protein M1834_007911 [Cirrosporium novae-zelandiae]
MDIDDIDHLTIRLNALGVNKYPAKQHARAVAKILGGNCGVIYLLGQYALDIEDSDQPKTWRQRRYFYYCSGVDVANCCLTYNIATDILTLYIPPIVMERVIWNGPGLTIEEAYEQYDIDSVRYNNHVSTDLKYWQTSSPNATFYALHDDHRPLDKNFKPANLDIEKLLPAIDACRAVKDSYEIDIIRKANHISTLAHRAVLENIHKFKNEAQIQGMFEDICISKYAKQSYQVIAGSGENASTLHYIANNESLQGRQLVCLDAGAEFQCYASDVTRTFPISGNWPSKEAKEVYDIVKEMQETVINMLKPGVHYLDCHILCHKIAIDGLLRLGILHGATREQLYEKGTSKGFFPHGLGHHLGLEVHDVLGIPIMRYSPSVTCPVLNPAMSFAPCSEDSPKLQEGMVITVEPGIYFPRFALETFYLNSPIHSKYINKDVLERYWAVGGVRIEDDILITADGHENLTTAPKGEEAMKIIRSSKDSGSSLHLSTETISPPLTISSKPSELPPINEMDQRAEQIGAKIAEALKLLTEAKRKGLEKPEEAKKLLREAKRELVRQGREWQNFEEAVDAKLKERRMVSENHLLAMNNGFKTTS